MRQLYFSLSDQTIAQYQKNPEQLGLAIYFDDQLVWAPKLIDLVDNSPFNLKHIPLTWPKIFEPYLDGVTKVTIKNALSEDIYFSESVQFLKSSEPVRLVDPDGRALMLNKYGRLGHYLAGNPALREELLSTAHVLQSQLTLAGYKIALCSASLLGAVRNGKLIDHDDDIDFLFYSESHDLREIRENTIKLNQTLTWMGYVVLQHSGAHTQVLLLDDNSNVKFYIDFFQGFFMDGFYNQPFLLRDSGFQPSDIYPFSKITLEDIEFDAPANPQKWLEAVFGPNYLTPDPSWQAKINPQTQILFDDWFGKGMTPTSDFWTYYAALDEFKNPIDGNDQHFQMIIENFEKEIPILDIGAGNGLFSKRLREAGYEVWSIDYCHRAVRVAMENGVEVRNCNIMNQLQLDQFLYEMLDPDQQGPQTNSGSIKLSNPRQYNISVSNSFHAFTDTERHAIFRLAEKAHKTLLSYDHNFNRNYFIHTNPLTWHYSDAMLKSEISPHLEIVQRKKYQRKSLIGISQPVKRYSRALLIQPKK
ncbi:MAG: class I SAM-dependent methyltransferase [Bifidobacteriaceae bacterium]|jgi:hypothetical protein|nr:class I SAM-dependent methyltransferase [Bifidobacteriaceae bacterium]